MAKKRISQITNTGTDAEFTQENYLPIDGAEGSKKMPVSLFTPKSFSDAVSRSIAPDYSELTFPISYGTLCMYGGGFYICSVAGGISTQEDWTLAHWTKVSLVEIIASLESRLGIVNGMLATKVAKADVVSSWQSTPDDAHVPSEKLVRDTIDNLTPADVNAATAEQGAKADTAIQGVKVNGTELTPDANNKVNVSALPANTKYAANIDLSVNHTTYVCTVQLKDQDGNNIGNASSIDLPLESVVVSGRYDSTTKKVILTLQNGSEIEFSVADLVSGLLSEDGDGKDVTVTFTQASARGTAGSDFTSGSTLATLFGKIKKWFADLGTAAFKAIVTSWSSTVSDDNIPSEKLVKDSLDLKQNDLGMSAQGDAAKFLNQQGSFTKPNALPITIEITYNYNTSYYNSLGTSDYNLMASAISAGYEVLLKCTTSGPYEGLFRFIGVYSDNYYFVAKRTRLDAYICIYVSSYESSGGTHTINTVSVKSLQETNLFGHNDSNSIPSNSAVIDAFPDRFNCIARSYTAGTVAANNYIKLASVDAESSATTSSFNYSLIFTITDPYNSDFATIFVGYETLRKRSSAKLVNCSVDSGFAYERLDGAIIQLRKNTSTDKIEVWLKVSKSWDAGDFASLHFQVLQNSSIQKTSIGQVYCENNAWDVSAETNLAITTDEPTSSVIEFVNIRSNIATLDSNGLVSIDDLPTASSVTSGDTTHVPTADAVWGASVDRLHASHSNTAELTYQRNANSDAGNLPDIPSITGSLLSTYISTFLGDEDTQILYNRNGNEALLLLSRGSSASYWGAIAASFKDNYLRIGRNSNDSANVFTKAWAGYSDSAGESDYVDTQNTSETNFNLIVPPQFKSCNYSINGSSYTNGPTGSGGYWGILQVYFRNGYPYQLYMSYDGMWLRYSADKDSSGNWINWNAWKKLGALTSYPVGSATQPVYVDSNGQVQPCKHIDIPTSSSVNLLNTYGSSAYAGYIIDVINVGSSTITATITSGPWAISINHCCRFYVYSDGTISAISLDS